MDKEKQKSTWQEIGEIRNIIYSTMCIPSSGFPKEIVDRYVRGYRFGIIASALYDNGYRKQSDTVREFVQKLDKDWVEVTTKEYGTFYAVSEERIQELAEKYDVKID